MAIALTAAVSLVAGLVPAAADEIGTGPLGIGDCIPIGAGDATTCDLDALPGVDDPATPCDDLITVGSDLRVNRRATVVQIDPTGAICRIEQNVIAELALERGVPLTADERDEILGYARDEVRARVFGRLLALVLDASEGELLSPDQSEAVLWLQRRVAEARLSRVTLALEEFRTWEADPCGYVPPGGHVYDTVGFCSGGLQDLFTGPPNPPTYQEFIAFGATRHAEAAGGETVLAEATGFTADHLMVWTYTGGAVAATTAFFLSVKWAVAVTKVLLPFAAAKGTVVFGLGVAAPLVIVVAAIVTSVARGIQIFDALQIEPKLVQDLTLAAVGAADPSTIDLAHALEDDDLFVEVLTTFTASTLPDFGPLPAIVDDATPDPDGTVFRTTATDGTTVSASVLEFAHGPRAYRAWLSDNWWVVEPVGAPGERTLAPALDLLQADLSTVTVRFDGATFILMRTPADGSEPEVSTSTAVPHLDHDGAATQTTFVSPAVEGLLAFETVSEGGEVNVAGVADGSTFVSVAFGDGGAPAVVPVGGDGTFRASRRIGDDGRLAGRVTPLNGSWRGAAATFTVDVINVAPTIESATIREETLAPGQPANLDVVVSDPGRWDTITVVTDWGDGTVTSVVAPAVPTHTYETLGVYDIDVAVTDGDGGADETSLQTVVNDRPQLRVLAGPRTFPEGSAVEVRVQLVDLDPVGAVVEANWGGHVTRFPVDPSTGEVTVSQTFRDEIAGDVRLTPVDARGATGLPIIVGFEVTNVAPTIRSVDVAPVVGDAIRPGEAVRATVVADDPGIDGLTMTVDWGDGTAVDTVPAEAQPQHTYADAGRYDVRVVVRDGDGGSTVETTSVEVVAGTTVDDGTGEPVDVSTGPLEDLLEDASRRDARSLRMVLRVFEAERPNSAPALLAAGRYAQAGARLRVAIQHLELLDRRGLDVETPLEDAIDLLATLAHDRADTRLSRLPARRQANMRRLLDRADALVAKGRETGAARLYVRVLQVVR